MLQRTTLLQRLKPHILLNRKLVSSSQHSCTLVMFSAIKRHSEIINTHPHCYINHTLACSVKKKQKKKTQGVNEPRGNAVMQNGNHEPKTIPLTSGMLFTAQTDELQTHVYSHQTLWEGMQKKTGSNHLIGKEIATWWLVSVGAAPSQQRHAMTMYCTLGFRNRTEQSFTG